MRLEIEATGVALHARNLARGSNALTARSRTDRLKVDSIIRAWLCRRRSGSARRGRPLRGERAKI